MKWIGAMILSVVVASTAVATDMMCCLVWQPDETGESLVPSHGLRARVCAHQSTESTPAFTTCFSTKDDCSQCPALPVSKETKGKPEKPDPEKPDPEKPDVDAMMREALRP